jgi:hypothetical protein
VFIIDTCHAGGAATNLVAAEIGANGVVIGPAASGPDGKAMARQGDPNKHIAIITASRANEVSSEAPDGSGGLFTLSFLDAVTRSRGRATLETVMKGQVIDAVISTSRANCRAEGPKCKYPQQTPELHFTGRGNLITL